MASTILRADVFVVFTGTGFVPVDRCVQPVLKDVSSVEAEDTSVDPTRWFGRASFDLKLLDTENGRRGTRYWKCHYAE